MLPTEEVRMPVPLKSATHTIFSTPFEASIAAMACSKIHTRYFNCKVAMQRIPHTHHRTQTTHTIKT
jgi:hypothetical protein